MEKIINNTYNYVKDTFSDFYIKGFIKMFEMQLKAFLDFVKNDNEDAFEKSELYIDDNCFMRIIEDVLIELKRLKDYHIDNKNNICLERIYAYFASYVIKRKPLFFAKCCKEFEFINEKFAIYLLTSKIVNQLDEDILNKSQDDIEKYFCFLRHHLIYRNTNPHVLELVTRSLEIGMFSLVPSY